MDLCDAIELIIKSVKKSKEYVECESNSYELQEACDLLEDFAVNHLGDD
jgi:hypothetical protein